MFVKENRDRKNKNCDNWEPPKIIQTHVFRHGHISCKIYLKSCEKRCLKWGKLDKILEIEKFFNYANEWEKRNHC